MAGGASGQSVYKFSIVLNVLWLHWRFSLSFKVKTEHKIIALVLCFQSCINIKRKRDAPHVMLPKLVTEI